MTVHLLPALGPLLSTVILIIDKPTNWSYLAGLSLTIGIAQIMGISLFAYATKKTRPLIPFWSPRRHNRIAHIFPTVGIASLQRNHRDKR